MDLHAIANRLPTTLRAPRLSYFGILCGHVWVWDACHMASAQNPQLSPTVTIYIAMTLFMLGVTLAALAFKPRQSAVAWADWPIAALMAASTVLLLSLIHISKPGPAGQNTGRTPQPPRCRRTARRRSRPSARGRPPRPRRR